MKNKVKKSLDSLIVKEIKDTSKIKGGGHPDFGETCYIEVGGQMVYC